MWLSALPWMFIAIRSRANESPEAGPVVLVGRSFGGLIAPRGASAEHRLAAMIVDPGQLEMGSAVMNRLGDLGQHLDDPAADARSEALLTIPALRTFLAPRMAPTA